MVKAAPADGGPGAAGGGGATRAMWASPSQTVRRLLHAASLEDLGSPTHTIRPDRPSPASEKDHVGAHALMFLVAPTISFINSL